jgi:serine/threonine protein kinase
MPRPGTKYGKWTVGDPIDRGGQGAVYRATGDEGDPAVAIKIVKAHRIKKRDRFLQEIAAQRELTARAAENVLPLIDSNFAELEDGGVSGYIVMPVAALSLETALPTVRGRCELALEVFEGILNGVQEAHAAGIIHRDLKPANILFLDTSLRAPLVSDFGICLLKETPDAERLTEEGETVGAKYFMAPEQEKGGISAVTEAADIYALGKLLHHMLTGRYIYREEIHSAFRPEELDSDPRYQLIRDRIIDRTVVHDPSGRIESVVKLIEVVQGIREEGRGGSVPRDSGTSPATPLPKREVTPSRPDVGDESSASSLPGQFQEFMEAPGRTGSAGYLLKLDSMRRDFSEKWGALYEKVKESPDKAPEAAALLIETQSRPLALTLALGRSNASVMFPGWQHFLELVIREDEPRSGYPAVFGIPHVLGGFLYMAATVQALCYESWDVLALLLNEKFEWSYRSNRPFYSYGFTLSHFFHPEALGRKSSEAHNLYRKLLEDPGVRDVMTLSGERLLNMYLQAQLLLCLRTAQEIERGNEASIWPDYGRFYGWRVSRLFDRAHAMARYGTGLAMAFKETPEQFFARLNDRLAFIPKHFWSGSQFSWDSISEWTPR